MTLWTWWKRKEAPVSEEPNSAPSSPPSTDALATLGRLAEARAPLSPEERISVRDALTELRALGLEARGLELIERMREARELGVELSFEVANAFVARGDNERARAWLLSYAALPDVPLPLLLVLADLEERRGATEQALSLYESVLARDIDQPRARDRLARLRSERVATPRKADATLWGGESLERSRFRVLEELGRGGTATVFLARCTHLGNSVALKVYRDRGPKGRGRTLHEARCAARYAHRGVVRILDIDPDAAAIAMELAPLGSMRAALERNAIDVDRWRRWALSLVTSLLHVHEGGMVHRDIKPSNLLLSREDEVVIADFGVAAEIGSPEHAGQGSAAYMPKEQRAGAHASEAMDVYAMARTLEEVAVKLVDTRIPSGVAKVLERARSERPEARPSMVVLRDALRVWT